MLDMIGQEGEQKIYIPACNSSVGRSCKGADTGRRSVIDSNHAIVDYSLGAHLLEGMRMCSRRWNGVCG